MTTVFIDTDAIQVSLREAAAKLQEHYAYETGEVYRLADLQQALTQWLELSIESLVEDTVFHTLEGDRTHAFNRRAFELQMQRLQPAPQQDSLAA